MLPKNLVTFFRVKKSREYGGHAPGTPCDIRRSYLKRAWIMALYCFLRKQLNSLSFYLQSFLASGMETSPIFAPGTPLL